MLTLSPVGGSLPKKVLVLQGPEGCGARLSSVLETAFDIPFVLGERLPSMRDRASKLVSLVAEKLTKHGVVAVESFGAPSDLFDELATLALLVSLPVDDLLDERGAFGEIALRATLGDLLNRLGIAPKATTPQLRCDRLLLRGFRDEDRAAFAEMNADPSVMEHFPTVLTREASDALVDRNLRHFDTYGFGYWAVDAPGVAPFIGFVGLAVVGFAAPFTPALEIGWRLARRHWGRGYATEGARVCAAYAFDSLGVREIVSFTTHSNIRSRKVMEAIGMTRDLGGDFEHPRVAEGDPLRKHVLFRLKVAGEVLPPRPQGEGKAEIRDAGPRHLP